MTNITLTIHDPLVIPMDDLKARFDEFLVAIHEAGQESNSVSIVCHGSSLHYPGTKVPYVAEVFPETIATPAAVPQEPKAVKIVATTPAKKSLFGFFKR